MADLRTELKISSWNTRLYHIDISVVNHDESMPTAGKNQAVTDSTIGLNPDSRMKGCDSNHSISLANPTKGLSSHNGAAWSADRQALESPHQAGILIPHLQRSLVE
tara:strand:+ start:388 stop:705 length:318 start_codon:yes stop_codon:yes gene_type:complete